MTLPAPTAAAAVLEALDAQTAGVLPLLGLCRRPDYDTVWTEGPELHRRFARLLLKQGHPMLALAVADAGIDKRGYADDCVLLYCRALAFVRCGNLSRAGLFVGELLARADLDPATLGEALSLAGRIHKDLGSMSRGEERVAQFRRGRDFYRKAFDLTGDEFPAINAATLSLLIGDVETSRTMAARVRDLTTARLAADPDDYWPLASLGEAHLLLGEYDEARERYSQAVRRARGLRNDGDIASMRRQLDLLGGVLTVGTDLSEILHLGPVVVFAGHGIDWPGEPMRFPADPALEAAVAAAIAAELDSLGATIGYCSPGSGSDILFAEAMRDRSAELHLILPFAEPDFLFERVDRGLAELAPWTLRYRELQSALRVERHSATTEAYLGDRVLYDFGGTFVQGLAVGRATQMGVDAVALVVRDPDSRAESAGLSNFVATWQQTGRKLRTIDLAELRRGSNPRPVSMPIPAPATRPVGDTPTRTLKAMLFADVAGFSEIQESHLPGFFIDFLRVVAGEVSATPPLFQNTWGDGLYLVFGDAVSCADFALRLLERLESFDFGRYGFEPRAGREPGVRIGLHYGPVFEGQDAVIGRNNFFGSHVSRAARIEPVTVVGNAFTSEQFAAALAMSPGCGFACEYLRLHPLAKDYDICLPYRLTRRIREANRDQLTFDFFMSGPNRTYRRLKQA